MSGPVMEDVLNELAALPTTIDTDQCSQNEVSKEARINQHKQNVVHKKKTCKTQEPPDLCKEAPRVYERLQPLLHLWQHRQLTDTEMVGCFILVYIQHRMPQRWLGGKLEAPLLPQSAFDDTHCCCIYELPQAALDFSAVQKRLPPRPTIYFLFNSFYLHSVHLPAQRSIVRWFEGNWKLILMTRVPSPTEVLIQQSQGLRVVSMMIRLDELGSLILGEKDALNFLLHDLIHADRFFSDPICFQGQIGFYRLVLKAMENGLFDDLKADCKFIRDFEYCISDMNSFCGHLIKYLKAVIAVAFLRANNQQEHEMFNPEGELLFESYMSRLSTFWGMDESEQAAMRRLNRPEWNKATDLPLIRAFFERHGNQL